MTLEHENIEEHMDKEERMELTARMTLARTIFTNIGGIAEAIDELPDWDLEGIEGEAREQTAEALRLMREASEAIKKAVDSLSTEAKRLKEAIDQDQTRIIVTVPTEICTELAQMAAIKILKGENWTINDEVASHLERLVTENRKKIAEWEEKNL